MNTFSLYLSLFVFVIHIQEDIPVSLIEKFNDYGLAGLIVMIFMLNAVPMARKLIEGKAESKTKVNEMKAQEALLEVKEEIKRKHEAEDKQVEALENLTATLGELNRNMTVTCERLERIGDDTQKTRNGVIRIEAVLGERKAAAKKPAERV